MVKVLVACEFSGRVRDAFIARGYDAVSCDLEPTETPGPHVQGDLFDALLGDWDLVIAFPPCTHLAVSGARWWPDKQTEQADAIEFVRKIWGTGVPRLAIENPVGKLSTAWRKPDQIIQPWMFGHGETKTTCLWLRGLPRLIPTNIVEGRADNIHRTPSIRRADRSKFRSRTYPGVANAMAEQWGSY